MDIFYYAYIWIVYNLLDVITTHVGILNGHVEANPLPAAIVGLSSPEMLAVYKLTAALLWLGAVALLARRWPRVWFALRLANILVFGAVFWNVLLVGSHL